MAGTLVLTTLSDGTNSTSATNAIQGSAKAWVNFNGSGGAIRASYNVSSITVNGTGDYTVNFTNAMPDTSYATVFTANDDGPGNGNGVHSSMHSNGYTASSVRVNQYGWGGSYVNMSILCVMIFR